MMFWALVRRRAIDGLLFRRQQPVGPFFADFYCDRLRLVIEVDGDVHDDQVERDAERTLYLAERGLQVIRFRNEDVLARPESIKAAIREVERSQLDLSPEAPLPARGGAGGEVTAPLVGQLPGSP